jgi:murein tripeptide amidase MpaA
MHERGVDFFLDVHGDELLPYVFTQGTEGIPHRTPRLAELEAQFCAAMLVANTDFQTEHSYPKDAAGQANLQIATNYVAETFQCLSLTLEMPFSDNVNAPDPAAGWSPERSARLGADTVEALFACVTDLRESRSRG